MDWTNKGALDLIEKYSLHPELWNRSDPKYKNKLSRFKAWSNIAESFKCTKAEVERKMNVLLTQYRREKHKMLIKYYEGLQPEPSKWYAFKYFSFMETMESSGMGLTKTKRRDLKLFEGIRHIPMLLAGGGGCGGPVTSSWSTDPFSPTSNSKNMLSFLFPLANAASSSSAMKTHKHHGTQQLINPNSGEILENNNDTTGPSKEFNSNAGDHEMHTIDLDNDNEINFDHDVDIKPEIADFLHQHQHQPMHHNESNRSLSSTANDDDHQSDDFAQDLRITSSRNVDFSHFELPAERGQSNESSDSKTSPQIEFNKRISRFLAHGSNHGRVATDPDKDESDYVGSNVSFKLRSMDRTQRIIAEKLISDVLFYGQFGELEQNAKIQPN